jgi:transposase-like protein
MPRTPKLSDEQAAAVVAEYVSGNTIASICALHDISPSTVRATVKRANVPLRPVGRPRVAGVGPVVDT